MKTNCIVYFLFINSVWPLVFMVPLLYYHFNLNQVTVLMAYNRLYFIYKIFSLFIHFQCSNVFIYQFTHQVKRELVWPLHYFIWLFLILFIYLHSYTYLIVSCQAGIAAAPARAVSAVKEMNIPQKIKDIKLPDLPSIGNLKFQ